MIVGNQVYSYTDTTLYLTPNTTVAGSNGVETVAVGTFINDANNFMNNQAAMWSALGANGSSGVVLTNAPNAVFDGFSTNGVLVNIRPGVVVKNSGTITVQGDATNPNGIDLSGSAYVGPGGSSVQTIAASPSGNVTIASSAIGTSQSFTLQPGLDLVSGAFLTLADKANPSDVMIGTVNSYNAATGAVTVKVTAVNVAYATGADTPTGWVATFAGLNKASSTNTVTVAGSAVGTSQTFTIQQNLNVVAGQTVTVSDNGNAANNLTGTVTSYNAATGALVVQVTGANGSGTPASWNVAFAGGSVLNTGDPQTLYGHFGRYDEPIVLSIRTGGNLNFGTYTDDGIHFSNYSSLSAYLQQNLHLGTLSDGFSQYAAGQAGNIAVGAGASAWAAPFDPAAAGAYNGLSGGLGADSANYFLTAGADLSAANPLAVAATASAGTLTVAGVASSPNVAIQALNGLSSAPLTFPITTDPLYLYNYSWNNGNNIGQGFADYASLVRSGTGNIAIATAQNLNLQSPLSLVYTAGTGFNVNGSSAQPLAGFTQYTGTLRLSTGGTATNADYLPASTYPTNGGNLSLKIGGNITGAMNSTTQATNNVGNNYDLEDLPYDMTALGSQAKLENWVTPGLGTIPVSQQIGSFNDIYATDAWMKSISNPASTFYTTNYGTSRGQTLSGTPPTTTGDYQLAWYTWFPYMENTIGSFGGGNISVKAGGSIANVQFVTPTNARDAGPYLVGTRYAYDPSVLSNPTDVALSNAAPMFGSYTGLFVQGGGNVSLQAGGDISNVYTYAQNGTTTLVSGGSVSQVSLATASGDVLVQARGAIDIGDKTVRPDIHNSGFTFTVSGISLIQNANILLDLEPFNSGRTKNVEQTLGDTMLTGILHLGADRIGHLERARLRHVECEQRRHQRHRLEYQPGNAPGAGPPDLAGRGRCQQRQLRHLSGSERYRRLSGGGLSRTECRICRVRRRTRDHANAAEHGGRTRVVSDGCDVEQFQHGDAGAGLRSAVSAHQRLLGAHLSWRAGLSRRARYRHNDTLRRGREH